MPVPDYQTLMLPLLRRLGSTNGTASVRQFVNEIADEFGLTEEERAQRIPSGQENLLLNRLAWARNYLGKAVLLESPKRGQIRITERGRKLLRQGPSQITNDTLSQFPEFTDWVTGSVKQRTAQPVATPSDNSPAKVKDTKGPEPALTPRERIDGAIREIEAALSVELLENVRQMTPAEFEGLILRLLLGMGYGQGLDEMAAALGGSGDGGIDGVIHQDPLGLERVYVQAKRYKEGNKVTPHEVRGFIGALNIKRATKGVFVTASQFTDDARKAAEGATVHVVLIDGEQLTSLMIRYKVGVLVRGSVEIKDIDDGFFET